MVSSHCLSDYKCKHHTAQASHSHLTLISKSQYPKNCPLSSWEESSMSVQFLFNLFMKLSKALQSRYWEKLHLHWLRSLDFFITLFSLLVLSLAVFTKTFFKIIIIIIKLKQRLSMM